MIDTLLSAAKPLVRINEWREPRPWGSTVAYETFCEPVLAESCVVVRVDADDILPVECDGVLLVNDCEVRLRFSMPQVGLRDGKRVVTYECEVIDE